MEHRQNTAAVLAALNGERSAIGRRLADPTEVHLVQTVTAKSEEEENQNLHIGYNIDGRMVRVVWARREPDEFKSLPHLFFLSVTSEGLHDIVKVATRGGYIEIPKG